MSHHVTSFATMGFLTLWILFERKPARSRVAFGALIAMASTLAWAIVQRSLLENYFGPIINDVSGQVSGGERREAFSDDAGTATPLLDQLFLLYYALALFVIAGTVAWLTLRWWWRGERALLRWGPGLLLIAFVGFLPVFLAARVVPKGGELFDRSSSFLFIALGVVVARYAMRLWWKDRDDDKPRRKWWAFTGRTVAVFLASVMFLGGYVLGSGPSWARLPGPFIPAADTRSMDAEVIAATRWARDALAPGSRIAGDRVGTDLLSSQAGVWPVMKGPGFVDAPALYVARKWGLTETDMARSMQLRYLYVDRRLSMQKPPFGSYFFNGETGDGELLTDAQLTKFDLVPAMKLIYRHGPISIYDLRNLGIPELRSGWYGTTPRVTVPTQLAVGLIIGLFIALLIRSRIGPMAANSARRFKAGAGPALVGATLLASVCLTSVGLLLSGVWLTPLTIASGLFVVAIDRPDRLASALKTVAEQITWRRTRLVLGLAIPFALIAGVAGGSAATQDIIRVQEILNDPSALHIIPEEPLR